VGHFVGHCCRTVLVVCVNNISACVATFSFLSDIFLTVLISVNVFLAVYVHLNLLCLAVLLIIQGVTGRRVSQDAGGTRSTS
jgi:hypothetical protein